MTPEVAACSSPPPSSSAVTTSPVAAFTSGGPPRKIVPWLRTITASSLIAGTYAPPAVHEPSTAAICGMPAPDIVGLVVEDAAEVLAVGEDLVLLRQERAARVDEVDARQAVVQRDLLRAQVLLHRHRVVGAALDGGVVGDDDALAPGDPPDAGDDARRPGASPSYIPSAASGDSSRNGLAGVEQRVDPVARQQLAARDVPLRGPARRRRGAAARELVAQVVDERAWAASLACQPSASPDLRAAARVRCTGRAPLLASVNER